MQLFSLAVLLFVHLIENRNAETIEVVWNKPDLAYRRLVVCSGILFNDYAKLIYLPESLFMVEPCIQNFIVSVHAQTNGGLGSTHCILFMILWQLQI